MTLFPFMLRVIARSIHRSLEQKTDGHNGENSNDVSFHLMT